MSLHFTVRRGACRSRTLLLTALLPGLAFTRGLGCVRLVCVCLARTRLAMCVGGRSARRLLLGGGKGIVAFGHEQGGKPPALP